MIIYTILHVLIAITSIAVTTYAFVRPAKRILRVSYVGVGLTLASGMYLVIEAPAHMLEACSMGVLYLAIVTVGTVAARAKLAKMNSEIGLSE